MKTKPEHLPALPDGAVYLGKGGEFKTPKWFSGWRCRDRSSLWDSFNAWSGDIATAHYCAPADSEIVRINTPQVANLTDADECPRDPPAGWVRVTEGKVQKHDWIHYDDCGDTYTDWAAGFIGEPVSDPGLRDVYRHPDRFNTPTQPEQPKPAVKKSPQELYLEGQKLANFQPGERVKVAFKVPSHANGWDNSWTPSMDDDVGPVRTVSSVHPVGVCLQESSFAFPWFCLERVKPEPVKVKLNDSYEATVVSKTEVKVGCQTFEVSRLRELLNACENFAE